MEKEKETLSTKLETAENNLKGVSQEMEEEEKEEEITKEKRKPKLIYTDIQIKIALNEGNKAQSMLLCVTPQMIERNGYSKDFSFLKFLQTNLTKCPYNITSDMLNNLLNFI